MSTLRSAVSPRGRITCRPSRKTLDGPAAVGLDHLPAVDKCLIVSSVDELLNLIVDDGQDREAAGVPARGDGEAAAVSRSARCLVGRLALDDKLARRRVAAVVGVDAEAPCACGVFLDAHALEGLEGPFLAVDHGLDRSAGGGGEGCRGEEGGEEDFAEHVGRCNTGMTLEKRRLGCT